MWDKLLVYTNKKKDHVFPWTMINKRTEEENGMCQKGEDMGHV